MENLQRDKQYKIALYYSSSILIVRQKTHVYCIILTLNIYFNVWL